MVSQFPSSRRSRKTFHQTWGKETFCGSHVESERERESERQGARPGGRVSDCVPQDIKLGGIFRSLFFKWVILEQQKQSCRPFRNVTEDREVVNMQQVNSDKRPPFTLLPTLCHYYRYRWRAELTPQSHKGQRFLNCLCTKKKLWGEKKSHIPHAGSRANFRNL